MKQTSELDREAQRYPLEPIVKQTSNIQQIRIQPIQQQIQILNQEINKLDNNDEHINNQKQDEKHQYQQQLIQKLMAQGEAKSIPHVKQNIETSNTDLLLYVLKESLQRVDDKSEYLASIDKAREKGENLEPDQNLGVTLSSDDFNPQYNMSWEGFPEKVERGHLDHRYDYYFPRGCYGFGLNVKKYGNDDWIKMDGNPNEWRILYHGTKNFAVNSIVKYGLRPASTNVCADYDCIDEFGNTVKVGNGIFFSDRINVCIYNRYVNYTKVGNKKFAVVIMSRVNPKKIRQSEEMKGYHYFLVNESRDVRPYRILLYEKQ